MHQVVNLYQPTLRLRPKVLSAETMLTIISIVVLLMLALYVFAYLTTQQLQRTNQNLALNHTQFDAQLTAYSLMPALPIDTSINNEIASLQTQIDDKDALLNEIDRLLIDSKADFGDVFEILAQTRLAGLWLTGIKLGQDGSIELSGVTHEEKLVPKYLRLITQHPPLASLKSGTATITREDSRRPDIRFVLEYESDGDQR